jgi:Protein of unknown function (DUF2934)
MSARTAVHAKLVPAPAVVSAAASALRSDSETEVAPDERSRMIAEAAYYAAERRGFEPGYELEDWLAAEAEVARDLKLAGLAAAAT